MNYIILKKSIFLFTYVQYVALQHASIMDMLYEEIQHSVNAKRSYISEISNKENNILATEHVPQSKSFLPINRQVHMNSQFLKTYTNNEKKNPNRNVTSKSIFKATMSKRNFIRKNFTMKSFITETNADESKKFTESLSPIKKFLNSQNNKTTLQKGKQQNPTDTLLNNLKNVKNSDQQTDIIFARSKILKTSGSHKFSLPKNSSQQRANSMNSTKNESNIPLLNNNIFQDNNNFTRPTAVNTTNLSQLDFLKKNISTLLQNAKYKTYSEHKKNTKNDSLQIQLNKLISPFNGNISLKLLYNENKTENKTMKRTPEKISKTLLSNETALSLSVPTSIPISVQAVPSSALFDNALPYSGDKESSSGSGSDVLEELHMSSVLHKSASKLKEQDLNEFFKANENSYFQNKARARSKSSINKTKLYTRGDSQPKDNIFKRNITLPHNIQEKRNRRSNAWGRNGESDFTQNIRESHYDDSPRDEHARFDRKRNDERDDTDYDDVHHEKPISHRRRQYMHNSYHDRDNDENDDESSHVDEEERHHNNHHGDEDDSYYHSDNDSYHHDKFHHVKVKVHGPGKSPEEWAMQEEQEIADMPGGIGDDNINKFDSGAGFFQLDQHGGDIDITSLHSNGTTVHMGGGQFNVIRDPWRVASAFSSVLHPHEIPGHEHDTSIAVAPMGGELHQHFTYINNVQPENNAIPNHIHINDLSDPTSYDSNSNYMEHIDENQMHLNDFHLNEISSNFNHDTPHDYHGNVDDLNDDVTMLLRKKDLDKINPETIKLKHIKSSQSDFKSEKKLPLDPEIYNSKKKMFPGKSSFPLKNSKTRTFKKKFVKDNIKITSISDLPFSASKITPNFLTVSTTNKNGIKRGELQADKHVDNNDDHDTSSGDSINTKQSWGQQINRPFSPIYR